MQPIRKQDVIQTSEMVLSSTKPGQAHDDYLELMRKHTRYGDKTRNLEFNAEQLFGSLDFQGRRFLDIGGGSGIFSFYAAHHGAKMAVCLEPEADGSNSEMHDQFNIVLAESRLQNIKLVRDTIQSFDPGDERFDIVLLNNSINHLHEESCIVLHESHEARQRYLEIFRKIHALSSRNATLVICDCSRLNIFPLLGLKNPFTPAIEWHKHQPPKLWGALLAEAGFARHTITWHAFNSLGEMGQSFLGNKCCSFFLGSRFTIKALKTG